MKRSPLNTARWLDFGLAAGSLVYGLYVQSLFWIAGSLLGFVLAWINPGKRIKEFLFIRMRQPQESAIAQASAFPEPPDIPYQPRELRNAAAKRAAE
jgi:hypothetical protein